MSKLGKKLIRSAKEARRIARGQVKAGSSTVLSVRVSENERSLLEAASELAHTSVSDFIRRKAVEAAEVDVLERRTVTVAVNDWEAFESWATRPAKEIMGLKDLARRPPAWRR